VGTAASLTSSDNIVVASIAKKKVVVVKRFNAVIWMLQWRVMKGNELQDLDPEKETG
jgi:hypothetical protein